MRQPSLLLLFFACLVSAPVWAQPGALKSTFGIGGKSYLTIGGVDEAENPTAIVVQPDGRIVIVGYVFPLDQLSWGFVARLMPGGDLDPSFGDGGVVSWIPSNGTLQMYCVALQPDGRIVLGGAKGTAAITSTQDAWFGRLNADGSIDNSFGANGERVIAQSANTDYVIGVAVTPDGGIYGHIHSGPPSNAPACMARLTATGQLDASFNGTGVRCDLYGGNSGNSIGGLAVRADSAALGAGSVGVGKVAAVLMNGQFDPGFGTAGVAASPAGTDAWRTSGLCIRPDGRILVVTWRPTTPFSIQFAQLLPNGSPDPSFGNNGLSLFSPGGINISTRLSNPVLYPDGRFLVSWGRFNAVAGELDHAVSWFTADGAPHTIGTVITDLGPNDFDQDNAGGLAMAPDGDIVALGSFVGESGGTVVLRFNGDLGSVGMDERMGHAPLVVHMDQTSAIVRLEWPGVPRIDEVVLRDALGRTVPVRSQSSMNTSELQLAEMTDGLYFIEVTADGRQQGHSILLAR
ncbi:MAG TPA: delta-60 repeat domain-containing protein [Flavobacteriales bacterium]|nr:delta-60 repeat domain-containing protein [Flavobacteriales bacterium]